MLPVHAGEHREQVGEAAVRDELLRPLEDVVLAVGRERRGGLPAQGVAPRLRLGEAVRGAPLSGNELPEVAILLSLRPVVDERQRADAGVRRIGDGERTRRAHPLRREHARRLVEREPAVRLGRVDHEQARVARLAHERDGDARLLVLEPVEDGVTSSATN